MRERRICTKKRIERDEDWKIDTGEKQGGGFPPPSRFRIFGRQLGYTQTEVGFRLPWLLLEEYQDWAALIGADKQTDAALEDLMED